MKLERLRPGPHLVRGAIALAALAAAVIACRPRDDAQMQAVRAAVVRYDEALADAFRMSRADQLRDVATDAEISRNAAVISGLASQGMFMTARQQRLEVERVDMMPPERAELDADETWIYEHRSLASPDQATPTKTVRYRMKYRLRRGAAGWRVDELVER